MEQKEQSLRSELKDLQAQLQDPAIFSSKEYPTLARRLSKLEDILALLDEHHRLAGNKAEADELANGTDVEMAEMAAVELAELAEKIATNDAALSEALTPKDPNDERNAIIEIRAAAGGDEASLFAGELYRMYIR